MCGGGQVVALLSLESLLVELENLFPVVLNSACSQCVVVAKSLPSCLSSLCSWLENLFPVVLNSACSQSMNVAKLRPLCSANLSRVVTILPAGGKVVVSSSVSVSR